MKNIVIYTQDMCGPCGAAKKEFESREWKYVSHNIKHTDNYDNLKALLPEVKKVYEARWVWYHTILVFELFLIIVIQLLILIKI